jgi:IS30 family transposase
MDTVYNDVTNGPYIQTFKFVDAGLLFALLHDEKTAQEMKAGVDQLETVLGKEAFRKYTHILLTDRGGEFAAADAMEMDSDGLRRTRVFYCDPMQSGQKGTLENNHIELRYILPKETDLKQIGLVDQYALNTVLSHVNSIPIEKFGGKTPFDIAEFMYPDLYEKLITFGLRRIPVDELILKPSLLKDRRPNRKKKHAGGRKRKISSISPKEVARLAAEGHSPKEIAERMGVSVATYYRRFPANKK